MYLIFFTGRCQLHARDTSKKQECCKDILIKAAAPYVGLFRQHHDFFNKAFSYQGIEGGVNFNGKLSTVFMVQCLRLLLELSYRGNRHT